MPEWCIVDFAKYREKGVEAILLDRIDIPMELMEAIAMEPWQYREEWIKNCRKLIKKLRLRNLLYPIKRYFPDYERDGRIENRRIGRNIFPPNWLLDMACRWLVRQYYKNHYQGTFCYCPGCGLELCRSDSWFSDTDLVRYKCIQCGADSGWLFDFPVPILVEGKRERKRLVEAPEWATHFFREHNDAGGAVPYIQEIPK